MNVHSAVGSLLALEHTHVETSLISLVPRRSLAAHSILRNNPMARK